MKYLSKHQILESLRQIEKINQFYGLTFLAAKRAQLPIGRTRPVSLDSLNLALLREFYSLDPRSKYFFRPLRVNNAQKYWLKSDYHSSGLQKMNTTTFKEAFIHEIGSAKWGLATGYVDFLVKKLPHRMKLSAFQLGVWLFRSRSWKESDGRNQVVSHFLREFKISEEERSKLFTDKIESELTDSESFQDVPVSWQEIAAEFPYPPDVGPDTGGILTFLEMDGVGPVSPLRFQPGRRLNIVTGDNGLGKTFLLEVAWYALTGKWADQQALPTRGGAGSTKATIKFQISGVSGGKPQTAKYSDREASWSETKSRGTISGLVVYARVDGSYAVWDPAGEFTLVLARSEIWDGKSGTIEGLIRDWTKWQDNPKKYPFDTFLKVLECMAPPDMKKLVPGDPVRLPSDSREIPTLLHSYGLVPVVHESAGIKHIITLAYLIVWVWNEHRISVQRSGKNLEKRLVVMVDEMEVHLHPRWQRAILPALLKVNGLLSSNLEVQLIVSTHSPLVLASAEPVFNPESDGLFHLEVLANGEVCFREVPFVSYGQVDSWLTSSIFSLKHARSREAEEAISEAIELQKQLKPNAAKIKLTDGKLRDSLPPEDEFWARWVFFAQEHGVEM
jgi:hypothetical protein